ncbi:sensor histidine kinase [Fuerstiella marisgermanici]|uniref:histidine kinase n=1 Tax=Fuerstiella marisgermanici TaxID=1891926 RepID=A0A1P8WA93_9PLAN|nr:CHASE domain-containing protein [Fuerstiella marisgermanici]APZ90983.1 Phytochrome-like protein cph [Fuerstiella marisgermanici]
MPDSKKHWLNALLTVATRHRTLTVALNTIAVAVVSLLFYLYASNMDAQRVQLEFEREADRVANRLSDNLEVYKEVVHSISSFYAGSENVSRSEFNKFVRRALSRHDGIHALEWVPKVPAADRELMEQTARNDGLTGFHFQRWEGKEVWVAEDSHWADNYFPVFFMQPQAGNEGVWGIDLGSNSVRRQALETAASTGQAVATSGIQLAHETGTRAGFLLFVPIYQSGTDYDQAAKRQENLLGFALGVFRIDDIANDAVEGNNTQGLLLQITEDAGHEVYSSTNSSPDESPASRFRYSRELSFASRGWLLNFSSSPSWDKARSVALGLPIILVGSLVALLLGLLLCQVINRAKRVEQLVGERTAELETANRVVRQHSQSLAEAKHVLEQSNQQLEEFAYAASHDLQTPLRGVSNFAAFLQEEYSDTLDETANGYIDRIISSADRMRQLILDLLEYSRVESKIDGLCSASLNDVFDDAVELLRTEIEAADAVVTRDDLPVVACDAKQMAQLFRNLISNGLKYRSDRPPEIHVAATDGDVWSIDIRDNGIGIEPRFHDRIFDIFRRLHTQQEYSGTGIGLALCRRIVQRHSGTISVESALGEGSCFSFTIPKTQVKSPVEDCRPELTFA